MPTSAAPMSLSAEMQANPPAIITAEGCTIRDADGSSMIDAVGGLWNVNLGYSCEVVKNLSPINSIDTLRLTFTLPTNDKAIELSEMLRDFFAPDGMVRSFFTSGGSDSVEIALRLARQYHS